MHLDEEKIRGEAFGRYVEELVVAENAVLEGCDNVVVFHSGMYGCCLDSQLSQSAYLVFHECDERCNDQADSRLCQCRYLECYALASPGGHQSQCIVS